MAEEPKYETKHNNKVRGLLLGAAPLIVLAFSGYLYATGGRYVETENAYIKAEIVTISANVDGQVQNVLVRDNQRVETDQVLFKIDPRKFEIEKAAAEAEVANAKQRIDSLRAQFRQGQMDIAAARERIRYLVLEHERQEKLLSKGVGTQARFDASEHALSIANRRLGSVQETNRMVLADLGGNPEMPVEQHPLYLKALAALENANLNLEYTTVRAPFAGMLSRINLEKGEYLEAGDPLFALVLIDEPWIEANLKEVQLTHVRVGQKARVTLDGYPDMVLTAKIESISPATGAEFAVLPPQNASGNWVKVVQRIPVRLELTNPINPQMLRVGMTVTVEIDTEFERSVADSLRRGFASLLQD